MNRRRPPEPGVVDSKARGGEAPLERKLAVGRVHGPAEREVLRSQLLEAQIARRRASPWIGRGLLGAVVFTLVLRNPYLGAAALVVGMGAEIVRQWRLARTLRRLWRALRDPMDGS